MLVPISKITVNPGRREALPGDVKELADSIAEVGLINPIMVDQSHTLIAGLHRLEAMKLLGRTEIECTVSDLDGLQVALAEIDENFVRKDLSDDESMKVCTRRQRQPMMAVRFVVISTRRWWRTKCPPPQSLSLMIPPTN